MAQFRAPAALPSLILAAALLVGGLAVHQASAIRAGAVRAPVVVTVDFARVLAALEARAAAEARLRQLDEELRGEETRRRTAAEQAIEKMRGLSDRPREDAARMDAESVANMHAIRLEQYRLFMRERIDQEKSLVLQDLHRTVRQELARLCELRGYDIVITDDSQREITVRRDANVPREAQVVQQISAQRILHTRTSADVTDELIDRMNTAFANR